MRKDVILNRLGVENGLGTVAMKLYGGCNGGPVRT